MATPLRRDCSVRTERRGHVLVVSMEREAKRNAIDRALADGIDAALNQLDDDADLWVGVLTGTPMVFSAGSDLRANGDYVTERGGEYGVIRRERRKPLIAAVEGAALGGGMEIVLACDLVVAASNASFGLPEVRIGAVPTCGGLFRGPQCLPVNLARELILTGVPIDAPRAHAAGFVNEITEPGQAVEHAVALAERICLNSPTSIRACLTAINQSLGEPASVGWEATRIAAEQLRDSPDRMEGVKAFLDKRQPQWRSS